MASFRLRHALLPALRLKPLNPASFCRINASMGFFRSKFITERSQYITLDKICIVLQTPRS